MLIQCYLKVSVMFLKQSFNRSNTSCEQALKEKEIRTQTTTIFRHSLRRTEDKIHKISEDLIKQLHKQHYQLHLLPTRLTDVYRSSYRELTKVWMLMLVENFKFDGHHYEDQCLF